MTNDKRRLVVLGTGFAAFTLVKLLRIERYHLTLISPRNHFLFTPLLPSTTVGTIEFRSIIEPIRQAAGRFNYFQASCEDIDLAQRKVFCRGSVDGEVFQYPYDLLVIAVGAISNTFRVPGVAEHALYLRELHEARQLRRRIIECFERASLPHVAAKEQARLLHFVVCGGGPTGVEFAAELHDLLVEDLRPSYPGLADQVKITLVEAGQEILSSFDARLRDYATAHFRRQHIEIRTGIPVVTVEKERLQLGNREWLPYGLLLWSTGNAPTPLAEKLSVAKDGAARLSTDHFLRLQGHPEVYALGDCAGISGYALPATAQVAMQQGKYLASSLNRIAAGQRVPPFRYRHLGMLAYIGGNRALADFQNFKGKGITVWMFWRSAYLTRLVSLRNKLQVMFDWMKAKVFGRDLSHF